VLQQVFAGLGDSLILGLAAQVRKPVHGATGSWACRLNRNGCIVSDSRAKHSGFLAHVVNQAAPNRFPT